MNFIKNGLIIISIILFTGSCTLKHNPIVLSLNQPEDLYQTPNKMYIPQYDFLKHRKACIFRFSEPKYAPDMGKIAANYLYNELLKNEIFSNLTPELNIENISFDNLIEIARAKKYDIIISGDLLYYFNGNDLEKSRVDEQIKIIMISDSKIETLWHAAAFETAYPKKPIDLLLFEIGGVPAQSSLKLMKKNATKFCNMILSLSSKQK